MLPPIWKIWRELIRLGRQALVLPIELARKLYFLRWYDFTKSSKTRTYPGALPMGPELAIYLIFPNTGLQKLHHAAIDEMIKSGVTPVIVSNCPLDEQDRNDLLLKSAWVMERPNIGYDFGGYRDAVLALSDKLKDLNRLWIVNDSTIFVPQEITWFEATRALGCDFVAATSNYGIPRTSLDNFRSLKWTFSVEHKNFHYASYAWSLAPAILRDPEFIKFWKRLDIRNDKSRTVRRGEIGFSQWVIKRGYSHGATWEIDKLDEELSSLSPREIETIAHSVQILDDQRLSALKEEIIAQDLSAKNGMQDRICFILYAVARQASAYAIPEYGKKYKGFHFMKRSLLK